jgi:hypothetical protein
MLILAVRTAAATRNFPWNLAVVETTAGLTFKARCKPEEGLHDTHAKLSQVQFVF